MSDSSSQQTKSLEKVDLASAYWGVAVDGFVHLIGNLPSTWYSKEQKQYQFERAKLQKYISPFQWGLGTTIFLFLNFRVTGSARFQAWRKQWRPKPSVTTTTTKQPSPPVWQSSLEKQRTEREQAAMASIKTLTDVLVSLSVGTSAVGLLLDGEKENMRQDMETAPLVAGRSVFSDVTCPNMIKTYDMFEAATKLPTKEEQVTNANLRTFLTITQNCRLRKTQEDLLRQRLGKGKDEPVFIPYPGVVGFVVK
jgi:hypothetical protein